MPVNANDILARIPDDRRAKIETRAAATIEEIGRAGLKDLRLLAGARQDEVAAKMAVSQPAVAKLEKRSDALLSTVQQYVQAIGGHMRVIVELPGREPVELDMPALHPNNGAMPA